MSAFIKFRRCDIVNTTYKTHPSQTNIFISDPGDGELRSPFYYLETEDVSQQGSDRNLFDGDGVFTTGSWNLSGAIEIDVSPSTAEKYSIDRLRNIYFTNGFARPQSYSSSSIFSASSISDQYMTLFNIPSVLYGSEIKPGSFKATIGNLEVLDDGFGGMISGSALIGSIFYQHGIVVLGHHSEELAGDINNGVYVDFSGTNTIPMTMYICTAPRGMMNYSNNSSFTVYNSSSNKYEITTANNQTFITGIGIYDENYELLGVAKVANPILNKESTSIQFRAKLHY